MKKYKKEKRIHAMCYEITLVTTKELPVMQYNTQVTQ